MIRALLPYQANWLADRSDIRIAEKSRRIGWSWASAAEKTLRASRSNGRDTWYIGYNKDMAREYIRDCEMWARAYQVVASGVQESIFDDPDKQILTYAINFASGHRITALSSRPTGLRGKRGDVVIDEAAFHDDLPGLMKAAIAVLVWGNAQLDIISTHNGVDNYFNQLIEEVRSKKKPYSLHRCTLDDALAQGLYKRICLVNGRVWSEEAEAKWRGDLFAQYGDDAHEELLCVPARSGGTYIARNLIERSMKPAPVLRLTCDDGFVTWSEEARAAHVMQWCEENLASVIASLPKDRPHFFGMDFGRVSDRSVITPGYLTQELVRKHPFAVEMLNVPFEQQRQVLFHVVRALPRFFKGALDATGNGAWLAEACALAFNGADEDIQTIEQIKLTDQWYAEHLPPLKQAFEDELIEPCRDADHMLDLGAFKVINGIPKLPKAKTESVGHGPPRHGDAAIAYALSHYASRQEGVEYGYQAAPKVLDLRTKRQADDPRTSKYGFKRKRGGLL